MSASRVQIPVVVQSVQEAEASGKPVEAGGKPVQNQVPVKEANVEITRRDAAPVKVYETESGSEISNKLKTDAYGQVKAWVEEGPYLITAEGGEPAIAPTNYTFDAVTGRGVEKTASGIITLGDLETVLATFLVPVGTVVAYAGEPGAPPTGFFTCDGSEKAQATYPVLYGKVKAKYGAAAAGNFRIPSGTIENSTAQKLVAIIRHD